ncbi:hypothetical protein ACFVUN_00245 [Kitasatospora griseola]|uniref:hypothetical protein n=1 Tax=Kitasatospora griseola TaxID=2064 RepID=UPI0036DD1D38
MAHPHSSVPARRRTVHRPSPLAQEESRCVPPHGPRSPAQGGHEGAEARPAPHRDHARAADAGDTVRGGRPGHRRQRHRRRPTTAGNATTVTRSGDAFTVAIDAADRSGTLWIKAGNHAVTGAFTVTATGLTLPADTPVTAGGPIP